MNDGLENLEIVSKVFIRFSGIPLGVSSAVPILLQNRGVSYAEQAGFTFAFYPFTSKSRKQSFKNIAQFTTLPNVQTYDSENIVGADRGLSLHQKVWKKKKLARPNTISDRSFHDLHRAKC